MSWVFRLRFSARDIGRWADRYSYTDDADVERIGREAGSRGWYTRAELLSVARWKTRGRSEWRCKLNTEADVRTATTLALATQDERERVSGLIRLQGVQLPTASVLLHLARPNLYPIIDFRALWSLGLDKAPAFYTFAFWWAYVQACRALATNAGISMRRLDRALWQYSKEHQPPSRRTRDGSSHRRRRAMPVQRVAVDNPSHKRFRARRERAVGPVERAIRATFSPPVTLETLARRKPFTLAAIDDEGIALLLGETESGARVSWECLEGVPSFLHQHPGWIRAGGSHAATGQPGTLDEHFKHDLPTHVANYVTRVLLDAGVVEVARGLPVRLRLRERAPR
jgi:hypothetical protein